MQGKGQTSVREVPAELLERVRILSAGLRQDARPLARIAPPRPPLQLMMVDRLPSLLPLPKPRRLLCPTTIAQQSLIL